MVRGECCPREDRSNFCTIFTMLSPTEQNEVVGYLGDNCQGDAEEAIRVMEKRKPNFMRYGRSPNIEMGKKGSDPNFLRFGKRSKPNYLRFGRSDPNFLRFGKKAAGSDPHFLRFGRSAEPNFLRFGRSDSFDREERKPNFLRFGRK
ncbi:unnamed protein product, partial [Mesorhabditis spiculigera]